MELHKTDILQINATVMVGVLILLTLGTLRHLNTPQHSGKIGLITASIIFPFAVSSIMVIISKVKVTTDEIKSSQTTSTRCRDKKYESTTAPRKYNGDDNRFCICYSSSNHTSFKINSTNPDRLIEL